MKFVIKFACKIAVNAAVLYLLHQYLRGFSFVGGVSAFLIGAALLAFISAFIRPIIRFFTAPLIWLTLGLFNFIINAGLLWIADLALTQLEIRGLGTLLIASIIIAIANAIV